MHPSVQPELVSFGVTPEVVVVVEYEDSGIRPFFPVEPCRGKTADPAAHDDEVVFLAGLLDGLRVPCLGVSESVGDFERARMVSPEPGLGGWIEWWRGEDGRRVVQAEVRRFSLGPRATIGIKVVKSEKWSASNCN